MALRLWRSATTSEKRTNLQGHLSMSLRIKAPEITHFSNHLLTKANGVLQENERSAIVPTFGVI